MTPKHNNILASWSVVNFLANAKNTEFLGISYIVELFLVHLTLPSFGISFRFN